jgi:hypothetical protein
MFVGAGTTLIDWPEQDAQREAIQDSLDSSIFAQLCISPLPTGLFVQLSLDNVSMGHMWPTRSSLSRRAWVELIAYEGDEVVFESGQVQDGEAAVDSIASGTWLLRSRALGSGGVEVSMPWASTP